MSLYSPPHPFSYRRPCLYNQLLATKQLNPRPHPPIFSATVITLTLVRMYALCIAQDFLSVSAALVVHSLLTFRRTNSRQELSNTIRLEAYSISFPVFDYSLRRRYSPYSTIRERHALHYLPLGKSKTERGTRETKDIVSPMLFLFRL